MFEVESRKDSFVRGDLARAVVESGWDLNELRPTAVSLEEIFLQLTGEPRRRQPTEEAVASGGRLDEKRLDHLPQGAAQLFRFAGGLSAADHVRGDLRVFLLERRWVTSSTWAWSRRCAARVSR